VRQHSFILEFNPAGAHFSLLLLTNLMLVPARLGVSLAGQSMGGNGAWEYASSQKGLFSAVVAICGYLRSNLYEDHEIAKRLRLPIWVTGLSTRAQARHPFCMQLNIVRHIYLVVILIGILVVRSSTRRTMS